MKTFDIQHLASAVRLWLSYVSAVGRDYILNESTIKIPVSEYLETSDKMNLELEYPHPYFQKRSIDLFFHDRVNKRDVTMEFKVAWENITPTIKEKRRILNDLMRLHFFVSNGLGTGYFLICGNQLHFNSSFKDLPLKPGPSVSFAPGTPMTVSPSQTFFSEWFNFVSSTPKIVNIGTPTTDYKEFYDNFLNEYSDGYQKKTSSILSLPATIKTKRIYLSPNMPYVGIPVPYKIGIWEVLP